MRIEKLRPEPSLWKGGLSLTLSCPRPCMTPGLTFSVASALQPTEQKNTSYQSLIAIYVSNKGGPFERVFYDSLDVAVGPRDADELGPDLAISIPN